MKASRPIPTYGEGERLPSLAPGEGASAADPLVILYTSGSSNRPKAVPLDHFGIIENGFNIGERQGLVPGDRVLVSIPLFWSYGAVNALPAAITHGATLVMQGHFEAGGALDLIEREKCTAIYTLPAMTNALVAHPAFDRRPDRLAQGRGHNRGSAGRYEGGRAARCGRDLQHLWRHRELRQLLRHASRLAAGEACDMPGYPLAGRAAAHTRPSNGSRVPNPGRSGKSR